MSSTSDLKNRTALVFGASGITGWAILQEALHSGSNVFSRVIGLSNRPMIHSRNFFTDDNRLTLVSGVDLTSSVDDVTENLKAVEGIGDTTDVYFAAYIQPSGTSDFDGYEVLKEVNVKILETAVHAVERICPNLRFWTLQTGGKSYGFVHVNHIGPPKVPCRESDPRIPQPYADRVFYYAQHDALKELSTGKAWRFAEIRPDLVIGFVPAGNNAMNFAQALGLFLSFYADREPGVAGEKKRIPFPGPVAVYNAHYTEIGQKSLGRAHIFASDIVNAPNGEVYNVGDSPLLTGATWRERWPAVCNYFGLLGVGPEEGGTNSLNVGSYMSQHQGEWEAYERKWGLLPGVIPKSSWEFLDVLFTLTVFDRQYDLSKFAELGFEQTDMMKNYEEAFGLMRKAKILP